MQVGDVVRFDVLGRLVEAEVASDAAIDARIDLLLLALAAPEPLPE